MPNNIYLLQVEVPSLQPLLTTTLQVQPTSTTRKEQSVKQSTIYESALLTTATRLRT